MFDCSGKRIHLLDFMRNEEREEKYDYTHTHRPMGISDVSVTNTSPKRKRG